MNCEAYGNPGQREETWVERHGRLITQRCRFKSFPAITYTGTFFGTGRKLLIPLAHFGEKFSVPAR
jgi:hypothetical protein